MSKKVVTYWISSWAWPIPWLCTAISLKWIKTEWQIMIYCSVIYLGLSILWTYFLDHKNITLLQHLKNSLGLQVFIFCLANLMHHFLLFWWCFVFKSLLVQLQARSLNEAGPTVLDRWPFKRYFEKLLLKKMYNELYKSLSSLKHILH